MSFEHHLRQEYLRRSARNPSYSLRAFARSLSQDASTLSKVLNGKRRVGKKLVRKLGVKLGMSEDLVEEFATVERFDARKKVGEMSYESLNMEAVRATIEWYFTPIYLLIQLDDFKPDCHWIGERLGVPVEKIIEAVAVLQRVGLLSISVEGSWTAHAANLTTLGPTLSTNDALKAGQAELLKKALEALMNVPLQYRDQSSMIFAFRQEDLPLVRDYIKKFRRRLDSLAAKTGAKNSIYATTISFFPLTKVGKDP